MKVMIIHDAQGEIVSYGVTSIPTKLPGVKDVEVGNVRVSLVPPSDYYSSEVELSDSELVNGEIPPDFGKNHRLVWKDSYATISRKVESSSD